MTGIFDDGLDWLVDQTVFISLNSLDTLNDRRRTSARQLRWQRSIERGTVEVNNPEYWVPSLRPPV
jgi:hypothetical protein